MTTITLTSTTGTPVELTTVTGGLVCNVPGKGIKFTAQMHAEGIEASFPITVGGKQVRPLVKLPAGDLARAQSLHAEVLAGVRDRAEQDDEIEARRQRTLRGMAGR